MVESSDFFCDGWLRSNRRCRQMLTNQCDKMYEKNTNLLPTCQLQPLNDGSLVSFISSNLRDSNFFISIYQSYCGLICHVFHQGLVLFSDKFHSQNLKLDIVVVERSYAIRNARHTIHILESSIPGFLPFPWTVWSVCYWWVGLWSPSSQPP